MLSEGCGVSVFQVLLPAKASLEVTLLLILSSAAAFLLLFHLLYAISDRSELFLFLQRAKATAISVEQGILNTEVLAFACTYDASSACSFPFHDLSWMQTCQLRYSKVRQNTDLCSISGRHSRLVGVQ